MSEPSLDRVRRWWYRYLRAHSPRVSTPELLSAHAEAVLALVVEAGGDETAQVAAVLHDALGLRIASPELLASSRVPASVVRILEALKEPMPYHWTEAMQRVVATPGAAEVLRACVQSRLAATAPYVRSGAWTRLARLDCADPARRPDVASLVPRLQGGPDELRYAATALGIVGTPAELEPLASAYRSAPDEPAVLEALSAIFTGGGSGAKPRLDLVPRLEALAADTAPGLRALAVRLLACVPGEEGYVLSAVADPDGTVAGEAALAVRRLRLGRAAPALVELVARVDAGPEARAAAASALAAIGAPEGADAVLSGVLVEAGRGDDGLVWPAARALATRPGPAAGEVALALLADPDRPRWVGAWLAGELRLRGAVPALLQALREPGHVQLQVAAARALGKLADRAAVPALIEASAAAVPALRREAIWALVQIGDPRALDVYLIAADERFEDTAWLATRGLAELDDPATVPVLAILAGRPSARPALRGLLRQADPRSVPALVQAMNTKDRTARRYAAAALVAIGAADALRGPVFYSASEARRAAIWALGELGDPADASRLAGVLAKDRDPRVRARAAAALGRLNAASGVDALVTALADEHPRVRAHAATALGCLGGPDEVVRSALQRTAADPHPCVRDASAAALRRLA